MGYIYNDKTEVKEESILLQKKKFLYLMKNVYVYSINNILKEIFLILVNYQNFSKIQKMMLQF